MNAKAEKRRWQEAKDAQAAEDALKELKSPPLTKGEAEALLGKARMHAEALLEAVICLYRGRAHLALGYRRWSDFAMKEMGASSKSAAYEILKAASLRAESLEYAAGQGHWSGNPEWTKNLKKSHWLELDGIELRTRDEILRKVKQRVLGGEVVTAQWIHDTAAEHVQERVGRGIAHDYDKALKAIRPVLSELARNPAQVARLRMERGAGEKEEAYSTRCAAFVADVEIAVEGLILLRDAVRIDGGKVGQEVPVGVRPEGPGFPGEVKLLEGRARQYDPRHAPIGPKVRPEEAAS